MSRREVILVLGLGILVLLIYLPSFPGEFHFDDFGLMLENPQVTGPHFSYWLFLKEYGGRPLTLWTFHWNYRLSGPDPWSFHAFSLVLHVIAAGLLFVWVKRNTLSEKAAFLAAAVFALHPLQTQAVNYIWSRSVLLMFCFGMASLLLARYQWLSLVCFQLAIWSRADGLIFLVPLVLANGIPHRLSGTLSALYRNRAPIVLALANLGAFALFLSEARPLEMGWTHPHALGYWWSQTVAFWKYIGAMVWPAGLSIDHDLLVTSLWPPALALLGLVGLAFALWKTRTRYPLIVCGVVWICLALAPAALLPNSDPFNESRAYPALAGFALILAAVFRMFSGRMTRLSAAAVIGLVVLAMIPPTALRNSVWRTDLALWQDAAEKSPGKVRVQYNLGAAWARAGDVVRAEQSFAKALVIDPGDVLTLAALGYCAEANRDWALALERYQQAVSLNSRNVYADEGRRRVLRHVKAGAGKQRL